MDSEQEVQIHAAATPVLPSSTSINLLSPINGLPPEVMEKIFSCVRGSIDCEERYLAYDGYSSTTWIAGVSHICRYWRKIAINLPTLWNDPPMLNLAGTKEVLARSKQMPLYIRFFGDPPNRLRRSLIQRFTEIARHAPRIKELVLDSPPWEIYPALRTMNSGWQLKTLEVMRSETHERNYSCVPGSLLSTETLRRLRLRNCMFIWKSMPYRNLTFLEVTMMVSGGLPTLQEVVDSIGRMQQLETLVLHWVMLLPSDVTSGPIRLPNLKYLDLKLEYDILTGFFQSFIFPEMAKVEVLIDLPRLREDTDLPLLFSSIAASVPFLSESLASRTLFFSEVSMPHGVKFSLFKDAILVDSDKLSNISDHSHIQFNICFHDASDHGSTVHNILTEVVKHGFDLQNIENIYIQSDLLVTYTTVLTMLKTFARLPAVRATGVAGGMMQTLSQVLQNLVVEGDHETYECFPNLELISIHSGFDGSYLIPVSKKFDMEAFQENLILRKTSHSPVKKLIFEKSSWVSDKTLAKLSEIVGTVDFLSQ